MKSPHINRRAGCRWVAASLMLSLSASAGTLYFQPTADSNGNINESWFSVNNWYVSLNPLVHATQLPQADDTVFVIVSEYACVVGPNLVEVNTLNAQANIIGGDFSVLNINSTRTTFNGSTLNVQNEWQSQNDQLQNATVNIQAGALLFINNADLYVDNSTLYDIGQIELMNGGIIQFTGGTNQLTVTTNAQFTGVGNTEVNDAPNVPLILDNNGVVQSQDGTLLFQSDSVFWTNSSGKGYFATLTTNAVIEFTGPFAVQAGDTNFFSGPGLFWFYNGSSVTINGLLQVGLSDPTPGTVDYHAYSLNGTGAVNFTGSPGLPSTLIWETGTFAGPTVNIDSQSELILSNNTSSKVLTGGTINNAGTATWLSDGATFQMDNGAVFNNLASAVFTAENNAQILGGGGSNASYFYNAGTFRKTVGTNNTSFAQDASGPSAYFLNLGLVDVQSGAVYLEWGTNSGQYNVGPNGQLFLWQGTNVQKATATFTGPGLLAANTGNFWLESNLGLDHLLVEGTGAIDGPGDLTINGSLTVAYGSVQGSGSLNISPNASMLVLTNSLTLSRNVTNAGSATVTNVSVLASQPLVWNNLPGSFLEVGAANFGNTIAYSGPPPLINNAGTLFNSGPTNDTSTVNWAILNSGQIIVNQYALDVGQSLTQTSGSIQVQPGATLVVSSAFGHMLQIEGGTLEGQGQVTGYIVNGGTLHPGNSPGILTLGFGSVTNNPGAELAVDIAGTEPGLQFSQVLSAGGQAWLNNLGLEVTFENGFIPAVGQSFVIWTNVQLQGTFSSLTGIRPAAGIVLVPRYTQGGVALLAANDPVVQSTEVANQKVSFSFQTTAGLTNLVEYTTSLSPPAWHPLTTIVGNGLVQSVTDSLATNATRFYRVLFE